MTVSKNCFRKQICIHLFSVGSTFGSTFSQMSCQLSSVPLISRFLAASISRVADTSWMNTSWSAEPLQFKVESFFLNWPHEWMRCTACASRLGNSLRFFGPVKRSLVQRFWLEQMNFRWKLPAYLKVEEEICQVFNSGFLSRRSVARA